MSALNEVLKGHYRDRSIVAKGASFVLAVDESGLQAILGHAEKIIPHLVKGEALCIDLNDDVIDEIWQVVIPHDNCEKVVARLSQHGPVAIVDRRIRAAGTFGSNWYLVATVPHSKAAQPAPAITAEDDDDVI